MMADPGSDLSADLKALAAADRLVVPPPHIEAAVMRVWDEQGPRPARRRNRVAWRLWPAVSAAAGAGLFAAWLADRPGVGDIAGSRRPVAAESRLGLVLMADPALDPTGLSVVRVRMPRSALASAGVPLAAPHATGQVDVEILVGEDGVARSILRAVPVTAPAVQE